MPPLAQKLTYNINSHFHNKMVRKVAAMDFVNYSSFCLEISQHDLLTYIKLLYLL